MTSELGDEHGPNLTKQEELLGWGGPYLPGAGQQARLPQVFESCLGTLLDGWVLALSRRGAELQLCTVA